MNHTSQIPDFLDLDELFNFYITNHKKILNNVFSNVNLN